MSDYIKREDAIDKNKASINGVDKDRVNHHWYAGYIDGLTQAIDNLAYVPSADVVAVGKKLSQHDYYLFAYGDDSFEIRRKERQ